MLVNPLNSNLYLCLLNLCLLLVTMQAQKASPPDMICKDKFLVQSVAAENGATAQDINAAMVTTLPLLTSSISIRLLCLYIHACHVMCDVCIYFHDNSSISSQGRLLMNSSCVWFMCQQLRPTRSLKNLN